MNYSKHLNSNVTISDHSPRAHGEHASKSVWQEVKLPDTYAERVAYINAQEGAVWFRPATVGGRARLFIQKVK